MMNGREASNGRYGLFDEGAAEREAERGSLVWLGGFAAASLLWEAGKYVSAALLFHQGADSAVFWARTIVGGELAMAFGMVWMGFLWVVLRFDWKSPDMAFVRRTLKARKKESPFAIVFSFFMNGIIMATAWEFVLILIGQGGVESTFGVVTAFMGALFLMWLVYVFVFGRFCF